MEVLEERKRREGVDGGSTGERGRAMWMTRVREEQERERGRKGTFRAAGQSMEPSGTVASHGTESMRARFWSNPGQMTMFMTVFRKTYTGFYSISSRSLHSRVAV